MKIKNNLKVQIKNAEVNQWYYMTLNKKSEGQGHRERSHLGDLTKVYIHACFKSMLFNVTENKL